MKKITFQMEPLTCPSCIKKIENALNKQIGIVTAKVLFHAGKVKAEFDEELITASEIEEIIVGLGYPVLAKKVA